MLDKLKQLGGGIISKVKSSIEQSKSDQEQNLRLKNWQDKLALALNGANLTLRDEREMIYLGTADVDKNINSTNMQNGKRKKANNVVNLVLEFIETNVDATIPQPSVRTKLPGYEAQASMIEDSLTSDITELGITAINDINERITPVQGFSAMLVGWNPDFKHHLYRGELTIESIHPKRIIPQPGVWDLQKMDYFFILSSVTKSFIKKRYGVDLESEGDQFPGFNSINTNASQPHNPDILTEIVCWYKNEDGEISKFVWCDNEILEDLPNFFARRINGKIETEETLGNDVTLSSGEVLKAGTKVPYFTPTRYPLIVRENIPLNFAFGGQSDVDVIRDQQDAMKKVVSTIEEKIMRGSAVVTALDGHRFNLTNDLYAVIRGSQAELNALNVKNLSADISQDLVFAQQQYKAAQSTLGITNSFQGKSDSTAVSGIAKQIQVNQSSGRLRSKEANKYEAYKQLYETLFEFKLSFYDELRPYVTKDANGQDSYGDFNKYAFLVRDKAGQLYYNTDFIFHADAGAGLPRDKMWLFSQSTEMLKYGAYNPGPAAITYWTQLVNQKFPNAKIILDTINQNWQMQMQMRLSAAPPKETINYKDLSPEAQVQMLQKIGINVPPSDTTTEDRITETVAFKDLPPFAQMKMLDNMGIGLNSGQQGQQQVLNQSLGQSPVPQSQQGQINPQANPQQLLQSAGQQPEPNVQQLIQEAFKHMTPEEQAKFKSLPDDLKIRILQEMIQG
ncbi:MAG: hypothetical protein Q8911_00470 [Bacillota bacterium]|nr:hypothetical protein [Bacillota bacterium]